MSLFRTFNTACLGIMVFSAGCQHDDSSRDQDAAGSRAFEARSPAEWGADFPAESDYAILLDVRDDAVIASSTLDAKGQPLLPERWLEAVSDAYDGTDAEDAVSLENIYEQWRLVSLRVSPCAPLGVTPYQDIDTLCWPTVRLVWQPVVEDLRLQWGLYTDYYADDRAIHAIYPLAARDRAGTPVGGDLRAVVADYLRDGEKPDVIPSDLRARFLEQRNTTADWLIDVVYWLRAHQLDAQDYSGIQLRPELLAGGLIAEDFTRRLHAFLAELAQSRYLDELTSFSLPEGRAPASADSWVFVGFDGNAGNPQLKSLNVIGRETGRELVDIGPSQTIAVGGEDVAIEAELARGNKELRDSLIISGDDIRRMTEEVADPYAFLVPNTSCGSCHRMNNDLRFNFHALSGFEDHGTTVSRRVERDVARDIAWSFAR